VRHYQWWPLAGHLRGFGGGQGQVVFGNVEEFGRVFFACFVGYGRAGAFVAVGWRWGVSTLSFEVDLTKVFRDGGRLTHLAALLSSVAPLSLPSAA